MRRELKVFERPLSEGVVERLVNLMRRELKDLVDAAVARPASQENLMRRELKALLR